MRVLVIEDDSETRDYLARGLSEAGWEVTSFDAPQPALLELGGRKFDIIVLDRMLPGMDGLDALRLIRGANVTTPVIMLTAMSSIDDRVAGLEGGADDYLVKPFALTELVARIRSIARRPALTEQEDTVLTIGPLTLDRFSRTVRREETELDLSPLEFKLLDTMMMQMRIVSFSSIFKVKKKKQPQLIWQKQKNSWLKMPKKKALSKLVLVFST